MSDTDRTLLAPPTPTIPQAAPTAEAAEDDEIDLRALFSQRPEAHSWAVARWLRDRHAAASASEPR